MLLFSFLNDAEDVSMKGSQNIIDDKSKISIRVVITGLICLFLLAFKFCSEGTGRNEPGLIVDHSLKDSRLQYNLQNADSSGLLDTVLYNRILLHLVHNRPSGKWPARTAYPLPGAILPFKRIIAYYGNYYSARMGILGELPEEQMLHKLQQELQSWQLTDTLIPVQPALHYIVVTAQRSRGKDNKYRLRMPFSQIDRVLKLATRSTL
ncbi:hypothetical protein [Terrimonas alba]|uniref:hypothetical protein n=1 Tax=Terrimonas alba TaxID=3349636 RepID=UPI0035F4B8D4